MLKKIGLGLAGLLLAAVIGAGIYTWNPLPKAPATLADAAANYDVEIIRDNWGIPHIYGKRDADVAFGLAYAHAEDDYETIQETVAATRGVLARYRGMDGAPTDYIVALIDVWGTVNDGYETKVPNDVRAIAEGYAAGMNLYASENPDATWAGLAPFTGQDVVAGFVFKTPFFYGFDETLLELFGDERTAQLALAPGEKGAWIAQPKQGPERGSNAFAVSPERSGDGVTRLMINSHQPMTGPVAWWEAHTVSEEGLNIQGGLFPGTPVVLHGFNEHLGWANTVSKPDLSDVYRLTANPDNENQYKLDGEWRDFERSTTTIRVKLFGPFAFPAKREVLRSEHGPVVKSKHGTYAVRYAGMGEIRQLEQYARFGKATNWDEFSDAMSMLALPSINYIYADKDQNIAFIHNGQYPSRIEGWDWSVDLPGDRSDLIWDGYRPYSDVPVLLNPESGLIYNANNQPYSATDGDDNLTPDMFPASMGLQTNQTNRSLRIMELTKVRIPIDRERLLALKFDNAYAMESEAAGVVAQVLATDWSAEPDMQAAAAHLAAWDMHTDMDSRHAALGALTTIPQTTERLTNIPAPSPQDAFRAAVEYLNTHYGRIDPEWGEVNRLVRGDVSLPLSGAPDVLRAIYPRGYGEDGILKAVAGDTWMALVEWDSEGNQTADVIHQFGNATLDETSPHYADQAPLFAGETWRRALITREEVEANAVRTYRPGKD